VQGAQGCGLVALSTPLHVRRLGTVGYAEALGLQETLFERAGEAWLLLLEHPSVYTLGVRARAEHVLVDPTAVGASVERVHRGGDVTYHGPGQLVGYVLVDVPLSSGAVHAHVAAVEQVVIDALGDVGVDGASRRAGHPGVWIDDRKVAAVGVRITRGRSMHGFALNVDPDLRMFDHIVPCGIHDLGVTSLAAVGRPVALPAVADAVARRAAATWAQGELDDRAARYDDVAAAGAPVTIYTIDPASSTVEVAAKSTLHGITGRADGVTGTIEIGDDGTLRDAHVEVEAERLRWGNPLLDRETRRRIDVRSHPMIVGDVQTVESTAGAAMRLRGSIAFLGVEREVTGDISVTTASPTRVLVDGEQTFDVRDWGLEPPNLLLIRVEPEIRVRIHVEAAAANG